MKNVRALIGYSRRTERKPYFYANAHEKDYVPLDPREVEIRDARGLGCSLGVEGFTLVEHTSAARDLTDLNEVARVHAAEVAELLKAVSGCDHVEMFSRGILRFSERSGQNDAYDNSHPARFVHVDMSVEAARAARDATAPKDRPTARSTQYNVWRVLSPPPQDVPLGLCAFDSINMDADLIDCDAIFDPPGAPEWSFGNYLLAYNPSHRWYYYSDMHPGEALVFVTSESDASRPLLMPHGAFDNPLAPADAAPRISLEMRGTAYWFA
ncbi:MAG: hypothetical protein N2Z59_02840 [Alteraurantiacibacter sp.]|nr:hypothetical protein [Alteraurantiacibacter sp.]